MHLNDARTLAAKKEVDLRIDLLERICAKHFGTSWREHWGESYLAAIRIARSYNPRKTCMSLNIYLAHWVPSHLRKSQWRDSNLLIRAVMRAAQRYTPTASADEEPDAIAVKAEILALLQQRIDQLPPDLRDALASAFNGERTQDGAARAGICPERLHQRRRLALRILSQVGN
jgi:DNA-directed RNA polymerase specialized sigma24 family protein